METIRSISRIEYQLFALALESSLLFKFVASGVQSARFLSHLDGRKANLRGFKAVARRSGPGPEKQAPQERNEVVSRPLRKANFSTSDNGSMMFQQTDCGVLTGNDEFYTAVHSAPFVFLSRLLIGW